MQPDDGLTSAAGEPFGSPEPPESERLVKLAGENARLRSEIRQAVTRAQRAEADANRVRSSTKFQVGDLLVKAARSPQRLLTLPRDVLRLYRLRKHRRTQPPAADLDTSLGRARRSDYSDELAARLLLPRISEQPSLPLSVAGVLDPFTAHQWRHVAALTSVMPHDAATLIRDVDPDVVVIDTSASRPSEAWSHLGDPAATDRALAARDLITAAKSLGRPVMLLRSRNDGAGFDSIGALCDLVVDLPGSQPHTPWAPGLDLGCVARIDADLLLSSRSSEPRSPHESGVLVADRFGYTDRDQSIWLGTCESDSSPAVVVGHYLSDHGVTAHRIDPARPSGAAVEQAVRDSAIVVLTGNHGDHHVGGSLLALLTLATGRALVSPDDSELRRILGLSPDSHARDLGWFVYPAHDSTAIREALSEAFAAPRVASPSLWTVWRALFDRASAPACWADAATRLGLGAAPLSLRETAFAVLCRGLQDFEADSLVRLVTDSTSPVREIICDHTDRAALRAALSRRAGSSIEVVGTDLDVPLDLARMRAAQASRSSLLLTLVPPSGATLASTLAELTGADLRDAILAYEIADSPGHVEMLDGFAMQVVDAASVLAGALTSAVTVKRPEGMT